MIRLIEHTAILATDTEALVHWYGDTLGLGIRKDFVRQDNNDHERGRTEVTRMDIKASEAFVSG